MFEHAEPAVAVPDDADDSRVQAAFVFALPKPIGRIADIARLVGGSPAVRPVCSWIEEHQAAFIRLLERRPTEPDGARLFFPDEVLVLWEHEALSVQSVRRLIRSRFFPVPTRCELEDCPLEFIAISRVGVVDLFAIDLSIAVRKAA